MEKNLILTLTEVCSVQWVNAFIVVLHLKLSQSKITHLTTVSLRLP